MRRTKKILFLGTLSLTGILWQSIIANVEPIRYNSLIKTFRIFRQSCDSARTAGLLMGPHTSAGISGLFVRMHRRAGEL